MQRQITPNQALALSFTPFRYRTKVLEKGLVVRDKEGNPMYETHEVQRFIKPGESQVDALKRLRTHSLGRTKVKDTRTFPRFVPGISTATYIERYEAVNSLVRTDQGKHLTGPSPIPNENDVEVLELDTFADDLV